MSDSVLTITLPQDPVRVEQLRYKLQEYQTRLERSENIRDRNKVNILTPLLENGQVTYDEVSSKLTRVPGESGIVDDFLVIEDYCLTGGTHVVGGTGLPDSDKLTSLTTIEEE